jgi:hypothetical protein
MSRRAMSESQRIEMEINISTPDNVGEDILTLVLITIMTGIVTAAASVVLVEVVQFVKRRRKLIVLVGL